MIESEEMLRMAGTASFVRKRDPLCLRYRISLLGLPWIAKVCPWVYDKLCRYRMTACLAPALHLPLRLNQQIAARDGENKRCRAPLLGALEKN